MALKDEWKQTGKGLGHAFRDLGKSIIKSAKYGVDKAEEWAEEGESARPAAEPAAAPDEKPE